MCLAVPGKIVKVLPGGNALADLGGIEKAVNVSLIEDSKVGDWIIIHVGFALQRIDEAEAKKTLALLAEAAEASEKAEAAL